MKELVVVEQVEHGTSPGPSKIGVCGTTNTGGGGGGANSVP